MGLTSSSSPAASGPVSSRQSGSKKKSRTSNLPPWVHAAMEQEKLAQPWKQHAGAENDDSNFAQSKDTIAFYDEKIKVCYGESSMAA